MKTLKQIIRKYMYQVAAIVVFFMIIIVLYIQLRVEQVRVYESSIQTFSLIHNKLIENEQELTNIKEEYRQTCLYNAEMIARVVDSDPEILKNLDDLRKLAELLEVDEIHIFDKTGRIFSGTHPEYYNLTFDSGEQIGFFKPMLEDKSLRLVQPITPNTAEGKLMQYSAVWCKSGAYIVQVGMEPVSIKKLTEKNEISYIFTTFKVYPDADYFDIDAESGEIIGSTDSESIGRNVEEIGIDFDKAKNDADGFHARVNGCVSFCVFQKEGDVYLCRIIPITTMYERCPTLMGSLTLCLIFMAFVLVYVVTKHLNKFVVDEIREINQKLNLIADGEYDETIEVRSSIEFSDLSDYINAMLKSILDHNVKMSYVLNKTNLLIGVYEYNRNMGKVRFTEYVPQIFSKTIEEMEGLSSDVGRFQDYIKEIHSKPVQDETDVYMVGDKYVKLDEIENESGVFGVVMDITRSIMKRKKLEKERDVDLLTGLLNRRGLDVKLTELFSHPEDLLYSAMIMIDADGLKVVNDTYGHECGDVYLKKIANVIRDFGNRDSVVSRQGGDEFVIFLYHYGSEEELIETMGDLENLQDSIYEDIKEGVRVPLRFSFGYCLTKGETNFQSILNEADKKMYQNKLERRKHNKEKNT